MRISEGKYKEILARKGNTEHQTFNCYLEQRFDVIDEKTRLVASKRCAPSITEYTEYPTSN